MRIFTATLLLICTAVVLPGCSTHSIWIPVDTVSTQAVPGRFPAHTNKVFMTDLPLPASVPYEFLGRIDAGKTAACSTDRLLLMMANQSREIGANAVINLKTWRQPSGWSWNAPHGSGEAIRIANTNSLVGLTGYWY